MGKNFQCWMPRCMLTIDKVTSRALVNMLSDRPAVRIANQRIFPTGSGKIKAESVELFGPRGEVPVTIARLPHLSRFQLFGNPVRDVQLDAFIGYVAKQIVDH
jgi:hypothetical protein